MLITKQSLSIENILFTLLCIAALFPISSNIVDGTLVTKQLYTMLAFGVLMAALGIKSLLEYKPKVNFDNWALIIAVTAAAEAVYVIFQFSLFLYLGIDVAVTGHFDNPAGVVASLCPALPFALYTYDQTDKRKRNALILCLIIFLAIIASRSRTGILIALITGFNYILIKRGVSMWRCVIFSVVLTTLLIFGAYFINTDSADGRVLIWRASWPMICDTPPWGNGTWAFQRMYMDYQAAFLDQYSPDSKYGMLAGMVLVPFNEYINLYLCFGIIGVAILFSIIFLLIKAYRTDKSPLKTAALFSLVIIAFISLFSYPFTYPFTYIIIAFSVCAFNSRLIEN